MKKIYVVILLFPFLKVYAQCNARVLPFTEDFSNNPFGACTTTDGGWTSTSAASGAGWWIPSPSTNYAGGAAPEVEAYGDQANGGISETIHLTSPPLNTNGISSVTLSFKHNLYLETSSASGSNVVTLMVESSADNVNWSSLYNTTYNVISGLTSVVNETRTLPITGINSDSIFVRFTISGVMFKVYGWEIDDVNVTAPSTTSINSLRPADVILYPNPAKEALTVSLANGKSAKVIMYDMLGKEIFRTETELAQLHIDTKDFLKGVYMLQIQSGNNTITKKIIKE